MRKTPFVSGDITFGYPGYIHFATHLLYDFSNPDLSNIVLSYFDSSGMYSNPLLFAFEIQNLHLNTKLVVLSTCHSGFGKAFATEGSLSLERSFLVAGANAVISANREVRDNFSGDFFSQFYSYHFDEHMNASQALREAQLEIWKSEGLNSRLDWGAFTFTGRH